jgi:hypothetical protein
MSPDELEREATRSEPQFVLGAIFEVETTGKQLDKAAHE